MDPHKGFHLEWKFDDGKGWIRYRDRVWKFHPVHHFENQKWNLANVITPTFGNQYVSLRLVCDGNDNSDKVFLDNFTVKGMP